jgi:flagellar motility protein MotE (MotC chaperone)
VNKKMIFIALGAGLGIFLVMLVTVWFVVDKEPAPLAAIDPNQPLSEDSQTPSKKSYAESPPMPEAGTLFSEESSIKRNLSETQLKSLIFEVRENITLYKEKLGGLLVREQRLQIAQATLRKDIEELSNLRVELASAVATLRDERDKLEASLIQVEKTEAANLQQISATYDKMDPTSAGKILLNMSQSRNGNSTSDDAVKILYYMTERVKAEVLASIAETEPGISAYYCSELKQVVEEE